MTVRANSSRIRRTCFVPDIGISQVHTLNTTVLKVSTMVVASIVLVTLTLKLRSRDRQEGSKFQSAWAAHDATRLEKSMSPAAKVPSLQIIRTYETLLEINHSRL